MELSQAQETDILSILGQHPIGIKSDAVFLKSSKFSDRFELAKALHQMTQVGTIYKKGDLFFRVDLTPKVDEPAPEPKTVPKVEPKPAITRSSYSPVRAETPSVPPTSDKVEPKMGSLRRTVGQGGAALALYKWRKERALTLDDLEEITGSARTTLYAAMTTLEKEHYAVKHKVGNHITFKWSGVYKYPFVNEIGSDQSLLKMDLATWKQKYYPPEEKAEEEAERKEEPSVALSQEPASSIKLVQSGPANLNMAVQVIDTQIGLHRQQLEALQTIRNLLVPA